MKIANALVSVLSIIVHKDRGYKYRPVARSQRRVCQPLVVWIQWDPSGSNALDPQNVRISRTRMQSTRSGSNGSNISKENRAKPYSTDLAVPSFQSARSSTASQRAPQGPRSHGRACFIAPGGESMCVASTAGAERSAISAESATKKQGLWGSLGL